MPNPCIKCAIKGCGRQAQCEDYLAFFNFNREREKLRYLELEAISYQYDSVERVKRNGGQVLNKYRPKRG